MNKTLMKNIPKMLMMGVNASTGKISIHKDFKGPILERKIWSSHCTKNT